MIKRTLLLSSGFKPKRNSFKKMKKLNALMKRKDDTPPLAIRSRRKKLKQEPESVEVPYLPPEIIREIFLYLPQYAWNKILSVNKTWNEIGKKVFIELYLSRVPAQPSHNKRWKMVITIGKYLQYNLDRKILDGLIHILQTDIDGIVRYKVIGVLHELKVETPKIVQAFLNVIKFDTWAQVRCYAIEVLGSIITSYNETFIFELLKILRESFDYHMKDITISTMQKFPPIWLIKEKPLLIDITKTERIPYLSKKIEDLIQQIP